MKHRVGEWILTQKYETSKRKRPNWASNFDVDMWKSKQRHEIFGLREKMVPDFRQGSLMSVLYLRSGSGTQRAVLGEAINRDKCLQSMQITPWAEEQCYLPLVWWVKPEVICLFMKAFVFFPNLSVALVCTHLLLLQSVRLASGWTAI